MRLLWVKAGRILPVDTGGKIRSYNLARQLAARHELTFLSYYNGAPDPAYERALCEAFPGAVAMATEAATHGMAEVALYVRRILSAAPFAVTKFAHRPVAALLRSWDREGRFDVMICDFLSASLNFPPQMETATVLFQHNVEAALWTRLARHEANAIKRWVYRLEAAKMARYERSAIRRFHHIVAVSPHDKQAMSAMTDSGRVTVVPTGVDLTLYRAAQGRASHEQLVLFLGSMDWEANVDGVKWFCDAVWPEVLRAAPAARFRIVGRNPTPEVRALASPSVEVTGTVPSVVEHLQQAAVFVVPLRVGGGTRLKIFEAMATGRAVVSTHVGAEGLDVTHGKDLILEDEPAAFAAAVVDLLHAPGRRALLERAAAATAARYDWSRVIADFEEALAEATRAAATHAA